MSERQRLLETLRQLVVDARQHGGAELLAEMRAMLTAEEPIAEDEDVWSGLIGESPPMLEVRALVRRFAPVAAPVLIQGESGTGKDVVARLLHQLSPRRAAAYVAENCAAIPDALLESLLFGHKRGAFTGAVRDHPGHFLAADKGTLFLDEIGDMPLSMQVKLLRTLQESEVRAVGGNKTVKIDVRVIAASNRDLVQEVAAGRFREDLFYRINVLLLTMPPLRDRGDDVLLLARRFLEDSAARPLTLGDDACDLLRRAPWPGNVRQLQNEMQRVAALAEGPVVLPGDLSPDLQ